MRNDKRDPFLDELLEASLKQYRGEEPRSGLEIRILAGVRSRQRATRWRGLVWAVAACAGILAAVIMTLHFVRAPLRPPAPNAALRVPESGAHGAPLRGATAPRASGTADARFGGSRLVRGSKEKPRTPKPGVRATERPEQFPTPLPLTEQESLLLVYLNRASKSDLLAKDDKEGAPLPDLEISTIQIAPLEVKPLDDSQSGPGK